MILSLSEYPLNHPWDFTYNKGQTLHILNQLIQMLNRSVYGENAHRKGIYREVLNLIEVGWHVMTSHIPGYMTPPEIEGYVPDIYAINSFETIIVEIATIDGIDMERYQTFISYAQNFGEFEFFCLTVDSAGCRVMNVTEGEKSGAFNTLG